VTVTEELRAHIGSPWRSAPGRMPLRAKIVAAFASAVLTVLIGIVTLFAIAEYRSSTESVDHARQVELATARTMSELRSVVLGARGYALTGLPQFNQPFAAGTVSVRQQLDTLRILTAGSATQRARVAGLDSLVGARIDNARELVRLRDENALSGAPMLATEREGLETMDAARELVAAIRAEEDSLLQRRLARRERAGLFAMIAIGVGGTLAFVLALLIVQSIRADVEMLQLSRDALADQSAQLTEQSTMLQDQAMELEAQQAELEMQNEDLADANTRLLDASRASESARAEAVSANQAKGQFLANMSHELRTPLNAIAGYTDLLQLGVYGAMNDEQRQSLGRVKRSTVHLLGLINDVLNFAKLEAGRVTISPAKTNVPELLDSVYPLVAPELEEKRLRFSSGADPRNDGFAPFAHADPEKLSQVLLNLLSNAVKFTEPGGEIAVSWLLTEKTVQIAVRDSGVGVPHERMPEIFEPFVQVRRSDGSMPQGTGLGLAISRDLARLMGGDLSGTSTPGQGSTFTIVVPRIDPTGS
jgi:signal transduction histidine kinase